MMHGPINIRNYEKFGHSFYQTNTKLRHKELFKLSTQKKGEHSDIKNEYIQNSDMWMYRHFWDNTTHLFYNKTDSIRIT